MLSRISSRSDAHVSQETWLALILGSCLNPLNSSMVAVAVFPLMEHFRVSITTASWVITSFYIAACVGQPMMGRLSDQLGPHRVFSVGMVVALSASVGAALSPTFGVLILMRVLFSLGTSAAYPSAIVLLRLRNTDPAPIATAFSVAAAIGPVVGGVAILLGGWSAMFWLNVPLTVTAGLIVAFRSGSDGRAARLRPRQYIEMLDAAGVTSFAVGLTGIVIFILSLGGTVDWLAFSIGAVALLAFLRCEATVRNPFIDVRALAHHRRLLATDAEFVLLNMINYGVAFGLPELLERARGYSAGTAGLLMFPFAAVVTVGTVFAPRLIGRLGVPRTKLLSYAILVFGLVVLFALPDGIAPWAVVCLGMILGLPYGIASVVFQMLMVAHTPDELAGVSAGIFQTARYSAGIAASAVIGVLFAGSSAEHSLRSLIWVLLIACGVVAVPAFLDLVRRVPQPTVSS
jgi:MFS family permease